MCAIAGRECRPYYLRSQTYRDQPDMIPEGESIKPDDEDLDNSEGAEIAAPDDKNQK